ncbi:MAG: hypothetical protein VW625_05460 [Perlucidibaca sp.]
MRQLTAAGILLVATALFVTTATATTSAAATSGTTETTAKDQTRTKDWVSPTNVEGRPGRSRAAAAISVSRRFRACHSRGETHPRKDDIASKGRKVAAGFGESAEFGATAINLRRG